MRLSEKIDVLREMGIYCELPQYIRKSLNPRFELRPYQESAFCNFITCFENEKLRIRPTQTLFHMATGSGKTLIMAGLILYLYKKGYRNFIFFVHLSNIVLKTKDNFICQSSSKYLFADDIDIDGRRVKIKEVPNFQNTDVNAVNICFTTIQGLHSDMLNVRENGMSYDDFAGKKVVLISDEAHHLSAGTKGRGREEDEDAGHWESTVMRIFGSNAENVLLEFTATCDMKNPVISAKYEDKMIFDYPLSEFRKDKYSKEIRTLRTDSPVFERSLQAVLLSQYRLKLFQSRRLNIKPVILFKSHRIRENADNMSDFIRKISLLTGEKIREVFDAVRGQTPVMQTAYDYYRNSGITFEQLAQEIKNDFSAEHCISANDDREVEENQKYLNSLEDGANPYRAVFAVDKLNEGWDVLNLFDIVRLYETRDGKNGKPGAGTVAEAQLIGRGARYCPFKADEDQPEYQRKYDSDADNSMRVCETLYYHCWNEPRYISELHTALREIGLDPDGVVTRRYELKDSFRSSDVYRFGYIFTNERVSKSRRDVCELPPSVRDKVYEVVFAVGNGGEDVIFEEMSADISVKTYRYAFTLGEVASVNYSAVYRALRQFDIFSFNSLVNYFPNVKSARSFITDEKYLGSVKVNIISGHPIPPMDVIYKACVHVLSEIADRVYEADEFKEGTTEFRARYLHELITDKSVNYVPVAGGKGVSQNDASAGVDRLDLSAEEWYVFNDNYGTSEEKSFVRYFKNYADTLRNKYDEVYLIRNERQICLYSFKDGERFEPDYILYLRRKGGTFAEQLTVFIEPKGRHLIEADRWKEDFLLELKDRAIPSVTIADDIEYKILGFHFYNSEYRRSEFDADMEML